MYNYLDYDNDRHLVRKRLNRERVQQTSIKDIGEILNSLIIEEKAMDNAPVTNEDLPPSATKPMTHQDLLWTEEFLKDHEVVEPSWYEEPGAMDSLPFDRTTERMQLAKRRVDFEDRFMDHSADMLSREDRREVDFFHTIRTDPYYKHYLRHHLRQTAEEVTD